MFYFPRFRSVKLTVLPLVSTVVLIICVSRLAAHEVLPTIADLSVAEDGLVTLDLRVNLEAFVSGIDLDKVTNTDADAASGDYDDLRALPEAALATRAEELVTGWNSIPLVEGTGPVMMKIVSIAVPEDVNIDLPRETALRLQGQLLKGDAEIKVNWPTGAGALVLRQQGVSEPYTGYLSGGQSSPPITVSGGSEASFLQVFADYVPVGFDHILPKGLDHILFVLGLFFLSTRWGPLLWQISAFTLAHTVTLALGALDIVNIAANIVEPLIAASIVFVAVENLVTGRLSPWRPLIVFAFGLLHGLGFASVLGEFGLPEGQLISALIGFNVGVELGQIAVITLAAFTLWISASLARHLHLTDTEASVGSYPVMFRAVSIPGSLTIALIGFYWFVERVFY